MLEIDRIYCGDTVELLKQQDTESVELVIADGKVVRNDRWGGPVFVDVTERKVEA